MRLTRGAGKKKTKPNERTNSCVRKEKKKKWLSICTYKPSKSVLNQHREKKKEKGKKEIFSTRWKKNVERSSERFYINISYEYER